MKVLQWNVLAQQFCHSPELSWDLRKPLLFKYIFENDCDVICLQECDFVDQLSEEAKKRNYHIEFKKKPTKKHNDGMVIMFKKDVYELVVSDSFKYASGCSQICLWVRIKDTKADNTWDIYCTHLKSKPGHEQLRLRQVCELVHGIFNTQNRSQLKNYTIVCGDFNETPEQPAIQLMSAYFGNVHTSSSVVTTSKTFEEKSICRCIDYIFYKLPKNQLFQVIKPLPDKQSATVLPTTDFPSDHLFILAQLKEKNQ